VYFNPLINWLWLGGFVFIFGTLIAAWPEKEKEVAFERVRRTAYAPLKA
jgi:cytochrome c-type biogenesis protein CcmF